MHVQSIVDMDEHSDECQKRDARQTPADPDGFGNVWVNRVRGVSVPSQPS